MRFPDAPSERAVKHVYELKEALKEGYECYVFFVIQMSGVRYFTPNTDTHPEFKEALKEAADRYAALDAELIEHAHVRRNQRR